MIALLTRWRLWLYAAVAAAFAALLAYAKLEQHEKRKAQDALAAHDAEQQAETAKAQVARVEIHDETQTRVQAEPKPAIDPQPVATAPAGSAAGKLRDNWSR